MMMQGMLSDCWLRGYCRNIFASSKEANSRDWQVVHSEVQHNWNSLPCRQAVRWFYEEGDTGSWKTVFRNRRSLRSAGDASWYVP